MTSRTSLARLPDAAVPTQSADPAGQAPHSHEPYLHGHASHEHHSHGHAAHGRDHHAHDHHAQGVASVPRRGVYLPTFSLFALSAFQRVLLALPVIAVLWLLVLWAIGVFG